MQVSIQHTVSEMGTEDNKQHATLATKNAMNHKQMNERGEEEHEAGNKSARDGKIWNGKEVEI